MRPTIEIWCEILSSALTHSLPLSELTRIWSSTTELHGPQFVFMCDGSSYHFHNTDNKTVTNCDCFISRATRGCVRIEWLFVPMAFDVYYLPHTVWCLCAACECVMKNISFFLFIVEITIKIPFIFSLFYFSFAPLSLPHTHTRADDI